MKSLDSAATVQAKDKEILRDLGRIIRRLLPGATIYLFGSAVKGVRQADSDLDVLVITNTHLSRQWKRGSALRTILALLRHQPTPRGGRASLPAGPP